MAARHLERSKALRGAQDSRTERLDQRATASRHDRLAAVIRMVRELADRAIKLFSDDDANERMRQRRRPEGPALLRALEHSRRQAIRAADHEREILALHAPAPQLAGEFLAAPCLAATVERNDVSGLRNRREDRCAFVGDRPLRLAASRLCGYFHKLQRQVM